jgi:hypothetical protein
MKVTENELLEKYSNVLTTKRVNEIIQKQNLNLKLTNDEHIWFERQFGVRKADLTFAPTTDEVNEYTKCKIDIHYFADKYCQIKREDGTIGPMNLRDYQKDIIDLYANNRYSLLCASRQIGKCNSLITKVLLKDTTTNLIYETTLVELYYSNIKLDRNLTIIETIKYYLYKLLSKLS